MQENAIYSVISPEGCAAILWRDAGQAKKAAAAFRPDAMHCLELGVIDEVVSEPVGGAQIDPDLAARLLGEAIGSALSDLEGIPGDDLRRRRRARFRSLGVFA
jgi:acetyl-CoA carboxylase carboxyl transferase subunit alpha